MKVSHCVPNCRAILSNEKRHFIWPQLAHDFLDHTSTLKKRNGMDNSVARSFIHSEIWGCGYKFITRAIPKHDRNIKLLRDFYKIVKDF